ncbi:DUF1501 domain-containing protein [Rubrivirga sp. IMCC43871]|uniref:DUF1501 domain-containing protein n=1 Tax=Rubrivirga sp. IMCC43871 TaxID=3391575 RepID=UPI00398FD4C2
MCHSDRPISLAHGTAHDRDHASWTRRDFMAGLGLGVAGAAVWGGAAPARAFAGSPLLASLANAETDRVLVLVQLAGGNDGLNTVIPVRDDRYYGARPTLAIPRADTISIDDDTGLHRALRPFERLWGEGDLAIVRSVGYDDGDLSHFRSTDIWLSGSDSEEVLQTGWLGRSLPVEYPDFLVDPPSAPPAVQVGVSASLLFQGPDAGYSMSVLDVDRFLDLVESRPPYDTGDVAPTVAGEQLAYLRGVANDAFRYRDAIGEAATAATSDEEYPDRRFGETLSAVARLVKGRLDTRVYLVSIDGFDTHGDQADSHADLLATLSGALDAFYADLARTGDADRVLTLTFSEFGRRIEENGSFGTDHGTAAPLFLAGPAVAGGLYGEAPDLAAPDEYGNLRHETDFRSVYATVLERWIGLDRQQVTSALGGDFPVLDVLPAPAPTASAPQPSEAVRLGSPAPNPVRHRARIPFALAAPGRATLDVFDALGRHVARLADGPHGAGRHTAEFDARPLPSGTYLVRLVANGEQRTVSLTVAR